jgi:hypothetical protein
MNTTASILALALGLASQAHAQSPKHVRFWTQYIEVPHATLSGWLNGEKRTGQEIHSEAVKLATNGGAKILETNMVVCRSGQKANIESIREEIYPTEYEPPELPGSFSGDFRGFPSTNNLPELRPGTPTAFETRNTGVILEVEPTIGEQDKLIDLRFSPEIVTPFRLETCMEHIDKWGDASIRMPVYETWRSTTSVILYSGKFELVSVIAPKAKVPSPLIPKRILLFVRADVVATPLTDP